MCLSSCIQELYASYHGYPLYVETNRTFPERPAAWGKIRLVQQAIRATKTSSTSLPLPAVDWVFWMDCDSYFMNFNITLDSILLRYAGTQSQDGTGSSSDTYQVDPSVRLLVTEDGSMLNTGVFFTRATRTNWEMLQRVWGEEDSPFINHPW